MSAATYDMRKIEPLAPPPTPKIYAYTLPGVEYLAGWIKIGQTTRDAESRIAEQTGTAGVIANLEWVDDAMYRDGSGETFADHDFHKWLEKEKGVKRREEGRAREFFQLDGPTSHEYLNQFANREIAVNSERTGYTLRREQEEAVAKTAAAFANGEEEFLWNAKPRFGKTLTAYALCERMKLQKVLVVSNRPSVSNSWAEDFFKFIGWKGEFSFVSENDALKKQKGVRSRAQFVDDKNAPKRMIAFESLQGLKGSVYFGGDIDKLQWMSELDFDLLIVDESHEGVDTIKTERAFDNIKRKHTLYLSGTPFRQLASARFSANQIYNWSYADEQEAKANWTGPGANPYESLPTLALFAYQMSEMIRDKAKRGVILDDKAEPVEYAFDLNEFFKVENGGFAHEEDVRKFVRALAAQEKYPFSTPELRQSLAHTMWYLNRVDSAKALKKLLEEDEVFKEYKIILAAGDGGDDEKANVKAYQRVKDAVASYEKTVTLTVGQLTVGVTVPEWSAVLMLCNMSSPAAYTQAAFRAQNPYSKLVGEELLAKRTAYVFDFDPARALTVYDDFANDLAPDGDGGTRETRVGRLLNFLPVIGEDQDGKMIELDAARVLALPNEIKSRAVVERGFMSNFLFRNIGAVFSAPDILRRIIGKMPMPIESKRKESPEKLEKIGDIYIDEEGEIAIAEDIIVGQEQNIFGEKIYEIETKSVEKVAGIIKNESDAKRKAAKVASAIKAELAARVIEPVVRAKELGKKAARSLEKKVLGDIDASLEKIGAECERKIRIAEKVFERETREAADEKASNEAQIRKKEAIEEARAELDIALEEAAKEYARTAPEDAIREAEKALAAADKGDAENETRARLRGFSRTIPSFVMAYGDENLKLANFETYVDEETFKEVANISREEFVFLRDGGEYRDEATGKTENFAGGLFDETVFDESIKAFLEKKAKLANYFDENLDEDIFDYIPPQKSNLIFTPRNVVKTMVDLLESENPGCFDNPAHTFADLYMKSGLYIAEIVKRLYRSEGLKERIPDDDERIRHIIKNQVYGLAPNDIIYSIATNYILGFAQDIASIGSGDIEKYCNQCYTYK